MIKKNHRNVSTYLRILILVLLPVLFVCIFATYSAISSREVYSKTLKDAYTTRLESICMENENSLQCITSTLRFLEIEEHFMKTITGNGDDNDSYNSIQTLKQLTSSYPIIDSISIVDRFNGTVYSTTATVPLSEYFDKYYSYKNYDKEYWQSYKMPFSEKIILPPTTVTENSGSKIIIPIVFTKIGETYIGNLLIVNVNMGSVLTKFYKNKLTPNSTFRIANKQTRLLYDTNTNESTKIEHDLYQKLLDSTTNSFDYIINGQNNYVITYSPTSSILGYNYLASVPYSDINKNVFSTLYLFLFCTIAMILIIIIIAFFSTNQIYEPIQKLSNLFPKNSLNNTKSNDKIYHLQEAIVETLSQNSNLTQQVANILPLAQERILINFLNPSVKFNRVEAEQMFEDNTIFFENNYFCSIIIKLCPTTTYYKLYTSFQFESMQKAIFDILSSIFPDKYNQYVITSNSLMIYVLLNPDNNLCMKDITKIMNGFEMLFDNDKNYIKLKIGIGNIYSGIMGLKQSHDEANERLTGLLTPLVTQNDSSDDENETKNKFKFTLNNENKLTNLLISGKSHQAQALINDIISKNYNSKISETNMFQLHITIYNVLLKVLRQKNLQINNSNANDLDIIFEMMSMPLFKIKEEISKTLDIICEFETKSAKIDVESVISYIYEHFTENIYLEDLATIFNTSASYLSKILKESLGITYSEYIMNLRIEKAKELLRTTKTSISELYIMAGFNNRTSFIRSFKEAVNMSPSDYRKMNI